MKEKNDVDRRGAGGTPGGLIEFFVGVILIAVGSYLFLSRVTVTTSFYMRFGRYNGFGFAMLPMLIGVGFLFFSRHSRIGLALTVVGLGILILGVLANLTFYFQPTNLITTLFMLGMIAGGLGLVARALQPH